MEIIVSDRAILNWDDFSIDANESVVFSQPSSSSCTLNRVVADNPSQILGHLKANGNIVLLNPNGVLFGKESQIDVGSLIASTLDLQDRDFLEGKELHFAGSSNERIQNLGTIHTSEGDLIFLAPRVENKGSLEAPNGVVGIGAGADILFSPNGTKQIFIKLASRDALIDQSGTIRASRIEMQVDGNPYQAAFQHSGTTDALGIEERNGEIFLNVPTGDAFINGSMKAEQGRIEILGQRLALLEGATLDVSGNTGGGTVLFGGDYQGKNPEIQNAEMVYMDPKSSIRADAVEQGDGGRVILWSDDLTQMYGHISAQGGQQKGDGGFVEVSGKANLDYQGTVCTLAASGKAGTLLLDPLDLTIAAANAFVTAASPFTPTGGACAPGPGNATLSTATLTGAGGLGGGNVIVQTTGTAGGCQGDIFINSAFSWATGSTLLIDSARDINVSATITSTAANANITLTAARHITVNASVTNTAVGGATVTLTATGGNVLITPPPLVGPGVTVGNLNGNILVRAWGGNVSLTATSAFSGFALIGRNGGNSSGDITVEASQDVLLTAATSPPGSFSYAGIARSVNQAVTVRGNISVTAGRDINLSSGANGTSDAFIGHGIIGPVLTIGAPGNPSNITVNAGQDLYLQAPILGANTNLGRSWIGCGAGIGANAYSNLVGNVGRNLILFGNSPPQVVSSIYIGYNVTGTSATSININVVNNIIIDARLPAIAGGPQTIGFFPAYNTPDVPPPECFIHCLGDIIFLGGAAPGASSINSGLSYSRIGAAAEPFFTSHLWAGGSIRCINGNNGGATSLLQQTGEIGIANPNGNIVPNISIRASGDVINASVSSTVIGTITTNGTGSATGPNFAGTFIEADSCFLQGDLWPPQTGLVNGVNVFNGNPLGSPSPATACDTFGAFGYDNNHYNIAVLPTPFTNAAQPPLATIITGPLTGLAFTSGGAGDIVVHSSWRYLGDGFRPAIYGAGTLANLILQPQASIPILPISFFINGGAGNVEISGSTLLNGLVSQGAADCGCLDSFNNITINLNGISNPLTTGGSIFMSAYDNLTDVTTPIVTTGAGMPITLISDYNDNGVGNLSLGVNVVSAGGPITLDAGFGAAAGGTSSINQTAGLISSVGGPITALAVSNISFSGAATSVNTGGGALLVNSTNGTIIIDENILTGGGNANFTAGVDILVNPIGGTSVAGGSVATGAGGLVMNADNNITINGDATSLSTTLGNITVIADADNSGFGSLTVFQDITSSMGGNICLAAGPGTFGCSNQNCDTGLISGFPPGNCIVDIQDGTVSSTTGNINLVSAVDIFVRGASPSIQTAGAIALTAGLGDLVVEQQIRSTAGPITTFAGNNTSLTQGLGPTLIYAAGEIRMITGLNMVLNVGTAILSEAPGGQVTIVVDNLHPNQPVFPAAQSGSLTMFAGTSITSGSPLRIFTAYSQVFTAGTGVNFIDPTALFNGFNANAVFGYPTNPGNDTLYERWCVFFGCPNNYPFDTLGTPFTFFYKVCIQLLAQQANVIVSQMLEKFQSLPPFGDIGVDEYWGWPTKFLIVYHLAKPEDNLPTERYFQRYRHFRLVHPPRDRDSYGTWDGFYRDLSR